MEALIKQQETPIDIVTQVLLVLEAEVTANNI
jgi:hypothetical protein